MFLCRIDEKMNRMLASRPQFHHLPSPDIRRELGNDNVYVLQHLRRNNRSLFWMRQPNSPLSSWILLEISSVALQNLFQWLDPAYIYKLHENLPFDELGPMFMQTRMNSCTIEPNELGPKSLGRPLRR